MFCLSHVTQQRLGDTNWIQLTCREATQISSDLPPHAQLPAAARCRLAGRRSALHAAYRAPLDWVEQQTTGAADAIVVNSCFTQGALVV